MYCYVQFETEILNLSPVSQLITTSLLTLFTANVNTQHSLRTPPLVRLWHMAQVNQRHMYC